MKLARTFLIVLLVGTTLSLFSAGLVPYYQPQETLKKGIILVPPSSSGGVTLSQVDAEITSKVPSVPAVTANTAKVGITTAQASAITANTAKVGITTAQASAITNNTTQSTQNKTDITGITQGTIEMNPLIREVKVNTVLTVGHTSAVGNSDKDLVTSGWVMNTISIPPVSITGGATAVPLFVDGKINPALLPTTK